MNRFKTLGLTIGMSAALLLAACGDDSGSGDNSNGKEASIGEEVGYTIVGIEPGAGITGLTYDALEQYENLEGWTLQESSTAGMIGSLDQAIRNEEPIIVTGWKPHWKFSAYDLKILEDPKGALGGEEYTNTLVRKGLEEDLPDLFTVLDRFHWEPEDVEQVMLEASNSDFDTAAAEWIQNNEDKVNEWTEGITKGGGEELKLITTTWDSELASSSVMKQVINELGYEVNVIPVDPAIMFQAIATGEGDASLSAALPTTHDAFYKKHKEDIVDLGENLKGTQNGFVVPAYMDIDSIEDLDPKK